MTIKPIKEYQKNSIADNLNEKKQIVKDLIFLDWVFSKPYEKIIILLALSWGIYSLIMFLWGLINL